VKGAWRLEGNGSRECEHLQAAVYSWRQFWLLEFKLAAVPILDKQTSFAHEPVSTLIVLNNFAKGL